jgi:hypothetical protein
MDDHVGPGEAVIRQLLKSASVGLKGASNLMPALGPLHQMTTPAMQRPSSNSIKATLCVAISDTPSSPRPLEEISLTIARTVLP